MWLLHPLPTGRQTDGYGERGFVPGVGSLGFHHGQDWAAPSGTPIRAMATGTVWANYFDKRGGWMVILKHSWGYTSYQHMRAKSKLKIGQRVAAGAHVGNVGSSGASTGPHLHGEVWLDGTPYGTGRSVDPLDYLTPSKPSKPDAPYLHPQITYTGDEEMKLWIADINGVWYLVVATGAGKPNATVLPGNSGMAGGGAARAGIPVIKLKDTAALRRVANV